MSGSITEDLRVKKRVVLFFSEAHSTEDVDLPRAEVQIALKEIVRVGSVEIKTHPVSLGILLVPHGLDDVNDLENPPAKLNR